jgi:hypothetical protein
MSTIKTTNIQHPSAVDPAIVLDADGDAVYAGVHDFTAATVTGAGGLRLVTPTSIANSGGSASASGGAVTYSGVTSVSLTGVFSATYQNYTVVFSIVLAGGADVFFRWRAAGTDASASNYVQQFSRALNTTFLGGLKTSTSVDTTVTGGTNSVYQGTVFAPFETNPTSHFYLCGSEAGVANLTGRHSLSTSYDGLTFFTASGTFSGTIRVYGNQNS